MRFLFALVAAVALVAVVTGTSATAATKGKPAASASPSPSGSTEPSAAATATPEPPDVAIPKLQAQLKANPNDREALLKITQYYIQIARPDLALQTAQRLQQLGVKTGQIYYLSGYSNMMMNRLPQATADLESASNLEPTNIGVLSLLADIYLKENRVADAERVAKRGLTFNKNDKAAYEAYGTVLEAESKFDEARQQYEAAAKIDPKDVQPLLLEARSYVRQNAIALAASAYDRALTLEPNNIDALTGKAEILAQEHDVKDAIPAYEKLRSAMPGTDDKASVLVEEARMYATEKMDDQALATYKSALQQYPDTQIVHVAYGDYFASKNDMTNAVAQWQAGLGKNRDNRDALGRLGSYYAEQKDWNTSLDYLKRLTEISPTDPRAWSMLGGTYAGKNDWQPAHDAFRHAYDLTHAPDVLKAVGQTDLNLHNYKEAQQIFEAIEKNGGDYVKQDPTVIYMLGQTYQKQGQKAQARSAYERFLAYLKPGTQAYSEVQKMIHEMGSNGNPKPSPKPTKKP
ncbi:MAG: tetratricopeptide repeat protein [Vulcanimicrobiaceae bacterium]